MVNVLALFPFYFFIFKKKFLCFNKLEALIPKTALKLDYFDENTGVFINIQITAQCVSAIQNQSSTILKTLQFYDISFLFYFYKSPGDRIIFRNKDYIGCGS